VEKIKDNNFVNLGQQQQLVLHQGRALNQLHHTLEHYKVQSGDTLFSYITNQAAQTKEVGDTKEIIQAVNEGFTETDAHFEEANTIIDAVTVTEAHIRAETDKITDTVNDKVNSLILRIKAR
jgi:hypothetical protein